MIRVEHNYDGVVITFSTHRDGETTNVVSSAEDLHTAIARLVSRFGEMQEHCLEELAHVGIKVRLEGDDTVVEDRSVS